jgi:hypothetical protein
MPADAARSPILRTCSPAGSRSGSSLFAAGRCTALLMLVVVLPQLT